jgi:hypothetical protein
VTVESIKELAHVAAGDIPGYAVGSADFLGDARFVISTREEFEDLGTHQVQAKHLAVVDVQENRAVLRLRAAYVIRDPEHGLMGELAVPVRCRLWLRTEAQSTQICFCSERNLRPSKRLSRCGIRLEGLHGEFEPRSRF